MVYNGGVEKGLRKSGKKYIQRIQKGTRRTACGLQKKRNSQRTGRKRTWDRGPNLCRIETEGETEKVKVWGEGENCNGKKEGPEWCWSSKKDNIATLRTRDEGAEA